MPFIVEVCDRWEGWKPLTVLIGAKPPIQIWQDKTSARLTAYRHPGHARVVEIDAAGKRVEKKP